MSNILVFGCTGLVGKVLIDLIHSRNYKYNDIILVASSKSENKKVVIADKEYSIITAETSLKYNNIDIIFFCSSSLLAEKYIPEYLKNNLNCVVIDNSSHYRLKSDIDIIIPPINKHLLKSGKRVISNSNCTTSGLILAIYKLKKFEIQEITITSLQSCSGSGYDGVNQLIQEQNKNKVTSQCYKHQIYENVIPKIGNINITGITTEEEKLIYETKKILMDNTIKISAMCIRVPIKFCHSLSIKIKLGKQTTVKEIINELKTQSGLTLSNDKNEIYTPLNVKDKYDVFISRIRKDIEFKNTFSMFICFNNLYRGASLNSIEIAEALNDINL